MWASPAFAATLYFDAPTTVSAGESFTLKVLVDTKDRGFNAAEVAIAFPTNILEVLSVDTAPASTVFNFWITLPSFSNDKGIALFSGGATRGLVGSAVQVLTIHMRATGSGDALITATDASVNASDGSGTNILDDIIAKHITVKAASVSVPAPVAEPQPQVPAPSSPTIDAPVSAANVCDIFFSRCELPFPSITNVSVGPRQQNGSAIFVSGTGGAETQIRLRLNRDETLYKRIYAISKPDGTWEAAFNNIFAYGTYEVEASTEGADGNLSKPATWKHIDIYPPYTLHLFGQVLRWYVLLEIGCVILLGATSYSVAIRYRKAKKRLRVLTYFYLAGTTLFVAVSAVVGFFWYQEFKVSHGYWGDTLIPCVSADHSFKGDFISVPTQIYVDGALLEIPADIGVSPGCIAQTHTHDNSGAIHIQPTQRGATLADFFAVTGETFIRPGYTVSVSVNGADYTNQAETYVLQNGDEVVVRYTRNPKVR